MALDGGGVLPEGLLALLHGDGVHDALALAALQACLHNEELGGVDHEGHLADLGVRHQQVHKLGHGRHAIYQPIIHVDVQHMRTLLDLQDRFVFDHFKHHTLSSCSVAVQVLLVTELHARNTVDSFAMTMLLTQSKLAQALHVGLIRHDRYQQKWRIYVNPIDCSFMRPISAALSREPKAQSHFCFGEYNFLRSQKPGDRMQPTCLTAMAAALS